MKKILSGAACREWPPTLLPGISGGFVSDRGDI